MRDGSGLAAPKRDMVRNARIPDRAQEDCIVVSDPVETILGHHSTGLLIIGAAPRKLFPLKFNSGFSRRRVDYPDSFRDDLCTDSISWNCSNSISLHFN